MCDKCNVPEDADTGINNIVLCDSCYMQFLHGPEVCDEEDNGCGL